MLVTLLFFGAVWFGLSQINLTDKLKVEEKKDATEERLGELILDIFVRESDVVDDKEANRILSGIHRKICEANDLDSTKYQLHIIERDEVNAFAIPDNHIVIFTGLIQECRNAEELAGVLAHEMAHCEENHVMKKLGRNLGASVIFTIASGGGDITVIHEAANLLTSTAYDRKLEAEADAVGVEYMIEANIDPSPLADFLYRLSLEEPNTPRLMDWISTHPGSKERSQEILTTIQDMELTNETVIDSTSWEVLKAL